MKGSKIQLKLLVSFVYPPHWIPVLWNSHPVALDPTGARTVHLHLLEEDTPEGKREKFLTTFEPNLSLRQMREAKPPVCINHHLTLALT